MKRKGTEGSFSCALFLSGKSGTWTEGRTEGQMDGWVDREAGGRMTGCLQFRVGVESTKVSSRRCKTEKGGKESGDRVTIRSVPETPFAPTSCGLTDGPGVGVGLGD